MPPSAETEDVETDGGAPSNAALAERMARVEQKQDHMIDTTEGIAEDLDTVTDQHTTLWTSYQGAKWILTVASGGGVLALTVQVVV